MLHSDDHCALVALLQQAEASEGVRIIYAGYGVCSRVLGTAHLHSDHDVKCIFVHPRREYFGLKSLGRHFKHVFPRAIAGADLEISGWEARHAVKMLSENNPAILGVLRSPYVFIDLGWGNRLKEAAVDGYDRKKLTHHWKCHGERNFQDYISRRESPYRKRYIHVLTPLFSFLWSLRNGNCQRGWPPINFSKLHEEVSVHLSADENSAVRLLILSPEELPLALPRIQELDAMIVRLLGEKSDCAVFQATSSFDWDKFCIELVESSTLGF